MLYNDAGSLSQTGSRSFPSVCLFSQRAHDVKMTSYQRRCDVMTSHRVRSDVILTSCAFWVNSHKSDVPCNTSEYNEIMLNLTGFRV